MRLFGRIISSSIRRPPGLQAACRDHDLITCRRRRIGSSVACDAVQQRSRYNPILPEAHRCSAFVWPNRVVPQCHRSISSSQRVCQEYTRLDAERLVKQATEALQHKRQDCLVEMLGSYRRGTGDLDDAVMMVTGLSDDRVPQCPGELPAFDKEEQAIVQLLLEEGVLTKDARQGRERSLVAFGNIPASIVYTSKACSGACKLYMTGDDSYIRFLKLLAEDGMGLTFDRHGLWRRTDDEGKAAIEKRLRRNTKARSMGRIDDTQDDVSSLAPKPSSFSEVQRAEMGLPAGLDLSLDLGDKSREAEVPFTGKGLHRTGAKHASSASDGQGLETDETAALSETWERIVVGTGSEADILDVLGMAWIPAHLRFVREPKKGGMR